MLASDTTEIKKHKTLVTVWAVTFLILFPLLVTLGLLMRLNQGEVLKLNAMTFYSLMTLHGLGMAGVLFSTALGALGYVIATRYARLSVLFSYFIYGLVVLGTVGLTAAALLGKYAAGWYLLYPISVQPGIGANWAITLALVSLIVLGVAWVLGATHIVYALGKRFGGFSKLMGWQYLGKTEPKDELPSIALITTVSLVPGILSFLAGAVYLAMNLMQHFEGTLAFDPLIQKNLVFFFGHTLVNITMYMAVGWVYELTPEFTHRDWKVNKAVVYAWNATFFFIIFAYFHHLYMDFAQPTALHYAGQIASYLSAIPSTVVTMFGLGVQVYRAKIKWSIFPLAVLIGMAGWAIGGFAAVVDSTIAINKVLHNTLWVPAHFHTYMLLGVLPFIFAFLYYLAYGNAEKKPSWGFWLFLVGAAGFLTMFYLGGLHSVPRRYSEYMSVNVTGLREAGSQYAKIAARFIEILLLGLLVMYVSLFKNLLRRKA